MIDPLTRKAWLLSVVIHAVVVAISVIGLFPRRSPPPPPQTTPVAPLPEQADDLGALILAEDSFAPPPPAPALADLPLSPTVVPLAAASLAPAGREASRGSSGDARAPLALPPLAAPATPELDALRTRMSAPRPRDWGEDNRRNAATSLQIFIENAFWERWRGHATRITNRTLVLWLETGSDNRILRGGLFRSSTGVEELDRAIEAWLVSGVVGLPPIDAASIHYVRITLP